MAETLILGAGGMLGSQLLKSLGQGVQGISGHDVRDWPAFEAILKESPATTIVNAIGWVKQRDPMGDPTELIEINALFPHRLAKHCQQHGRRLIHFSTDCVFSGHTGNYSETDIPDPIDLYGQSKWLGEMTGPNLFTLRTSFIGLEQQRKTSLVEWFLLQKQPILGYSDAIYSGFTTLEMARIVERIVAAPDELAGLYHVASSPISKYDLLVSLRNALGSELSVSRYPDFSCNRSLNGDKFNRTFGYEPATWPAMIQELAIQIKSRDHEF
jgi:dTDP-4-dehydrorhamnose reductase